MGTSCSRGGGGIGLQFGVRNGVSGLQGGRGGGDVVGITVVGSILWWTGCSSIRGVGCCIELK